MSDVTTLEEGVIVTIKRNFINMKFKLVESENTHYGVVQKKSQNGVKEEVKDFVK